MNSLSSLNNSRPYDILVNMDQKSRKLAGNIPSYETAASSWTGVLFSLGSHQMLLPMDVVREIILMPTITRVPGTKNWVRGIANLRGTLFPVLDIEDALGIRSSEAPNPTQQRLLIVTFEGFPVGIIVTAVVGMKNFMSSDNREEIPLLDEALTPFLQGAYSSLDECFPVLSVEALMQDERIQAIDIKSTVQM